jgi:hypothetical protein
MKKILLLLLLISSVGMASAQSELPSDTLRRAPATNIKEFGGFLIDMGLMNVRPPQLPKFSLKIPDASKDYNRIFSLNNNVYYTQGLTSIFSPALSDFNYGFGLFSSSPQYMQMSTFKLKNGWQINTYGDYNEKGFRVPNQSAMPWQRNNFRGAFELKSANGNFGLRIEVQQGRNTPF